MLKEVDRKRAYRVTPTGLYLFSTWRDGKPNVQFAFRALGLMDDPARVLVGVQHGNYSLEAFRQTQEFVLNSCSQKQVPAIDPSRTMSGREVADKFVALGLETIPAKHVKAPLVVGCHANLECRVLHSLDIEGVTLFVADVLAAYVDEELPPVARFLGKTWRLDGPLD